MKTVTFICIRNTKQDHNAIANKLIDRALTALYNKEIRLARRCINAAGIISSSPKVLKLQSMIEQIQQGLKNEQVARAKAEERTIAIETANKYMSKNEFVKVVETLEPFVIENPDDQEISQLFQDAQEGINKQILQLIAQGDSLYRSERTKEALVVWKQAEKLNPNFEGLNTRIARAEKVLEQLQKIKKSN